MSPQRTYRALLWALFAPVDCGTSGTCFFLESAFIHFSANGSDKSRKVVTVRAEGRNQAIARSATAALQFFFQRPTGKPQHIFQEGPFNRCRAMLNQTCPWLGRICPVQTNILNRGFTTEEPKSPLESAGSLFTSNERDFPRRGLATSKQDQ